MLPHDMTLTTRVSLKQYTKLMFMLAYRKPILILLVSFNILMIAWVISYFAGWLKLPEPEYPQYMAIFLITIVQPLMIYLAVRSNYKSSTRLNSEMKLTFTHEKLIISGHMFYSEFSWYKAYKLVEYKNWFLIYENTLAAVLIHKNDITKEEQLKFKALIKTIPDLDLTLRES